MATFKHKMMLADITIELERKLLEKLVMSSVT